MKNVLIIEHENELSNRLRSRFDEAEKFSKLPNINITIISKHKSALIKEEFVKETDFIFIDNIVYTTYPDSTRPNNLILIDFFKKFSSYSDKMTLITCCEDHKNLTKTFMRNNNIFGIKFLMNEDFKQQMEIINLGENWICKKWFNLLKEFEIEITENSLKREKEYDNDHFCSFKSGRPPKIIQPGRYKIELYSNKAELTVKTFLEFLEEKNSIVAGEEMDIAEIRKELPWNSKTLFFDEKERLRKEDGHPVVLAISRWGNEFNIVMNSFALDMMDYAGANLCTVSILYVYTNKPHGSPSGLFI